MNKNVHTLISDDLVGEKYILLADDDSDDCMFFANALEELKVPFKLKTVFDGEQFMNFLENKENLPDIIFLDMNMPCKNGFECLVEIRKSERYKMIPVIIISTSLDENIIKSLHENGAFFYIKKPSLFAHLKKLMSLVINLIAAGNYRQPSIEKFVLTAEINAL